MTWVPLRIFGANKVIQRKEMIMCPDDLVCYFFYHIGLKTRTTFHWIDDYRVERVIMGLELVWKNLSATLTNGVGWTTGVERVAQLVAQRRIPEYWWALGLQCQTF